MRVTMAAQKRLRRLFPQIFMIDHAEMKGFSTNNNLAFSQSHGRYLMLLNDDTIVKPGRVADYGRFYGQSPGGRSLRSELNKPRWQSTTELFLFSQSIL